MAAAQVGVEFNSSRQFMSWLQEQQASLGFSTYQGGKIYFIGSKPDGRMEVMERTFARPMGFCVDGSQRLWLSSLWQMWRFDNTLEAGQGYEHYDRFFLPTQAWTTGDLDIHDMGVGEGGKLYFVNSLFSCLATLSDTGHSFKPLWKPPFISKLAPEDRCHLNGLALVNGKPKYVSAISRTDVNEGWREHRRDGGVVIDIDTNEIVCSGLSMPHSPRWHEGTLYLHNSGTGEFGRVDLTTRSFVPIAFIPGYLRGLSFVGKHFAIAGLSEPRHNKSFQGLALSEALSSRGVSARCGLQVIDLRDGSLPHSVQLEGYVNELYDVITLPGVRMPYVMGTMKDDIRRFIRIDNG